MLDTKAFFDLVLPDAGTYFVAVARPGRQGLVHHAFADKAQAAAAALAFDAQAAAVYFAIHGYRREKVYTGETWPDGRPKYKQRTADNVVACRSFYLDIDVGPSEPGKPPKYATRDEAADGIARLCREAGLPIPLVVASGPAGLHTYWPLAADVTPEAWLVVARQLKALCTELRVLADPVRTADIASVLRPVGTHHRKSGAPVRVEALNTVEPVDYADFAARVRVAIRAHGIAADPAGRNLYRAVNEGAGVARMYERTNADLIADRCAQIRQVRDTRGNVPEPAWYAAIGVLRHTRQAPAVIHDWSSGYPGYSREETDRKIKQWEERGLGPTTCAEFMAKNPAGCDGCPFNTKSAAGRVVVSPHQLGVEIEVAEPPRVTVASDPATGHEIVAELPNPPAPFIRVSGPNSGLYVEHQGVPVKFYDYDLYPVRVNYDKWLGEETVTVRHWLPQDGWLEFTIPARLLETQRDFNMALRAQSVQPYEGALSGMLGKYMNEYIRKLKQQRKIRRLYTSMGWHDDGFVLGDVIITPDGVREAGVSKKVEPIIHSLRSSGSLDEWRRVTAVLGRPGLEHHAFAFLAGFGAPIVKLLRSHKGLLLNMVGVTSGGKTTIAKLIMSIYGEPDENKQNNNSTLNNRIERIGAYNNLPVFIDEISNMTPAEASELVYSISSGEGRGRLNKDATFKEIARWSTLVVSTSNHSIYGKLLAIKDAPDAETMRVLEWEVPAIEDPAWAEDMNRVIRDHFGVAGRVYIEFLVKNQQRVVALTEELEGHLRKLLGFKSRERFWFMAASAMYAGGLLARELGLIEYDPLVSLPWFRALVESLRTAVKTGHASALDALAEVINESYGDRVVVRTEKVGTREIVSVVKAPQRSITSVLWLDSRTLYISSSLVRQALWKRGIDSNRAQAELAAIGVLKSKCKKRLSAGIDGYDAPPVWVWVVDLNHEALRDKLEE